MKTKRKWMILGLVIILVVSGLIIATNANEKTDELNTLNSIQGTQATGNKYAPEEIIVNFKPGVKGEVVSNINSRHGASVLYTSRFAGFKVLKIPKGKTVLEMVEIYSKNPNVDYAEPNYMVHALMVPNDPYYGYQWHLDNEVFGGINMECAWDISTGAGVTVAVIDTGVAYETYKEGKKQYCKAPDLANTCFVQGYDFVNNDAHPNDDNNHGTHVAGTVAQSTNNGVGVAGVAFDACIMPVKVLDKSGSGTYDGVADGIYYAADNGADVISMSLGGSSPSITIENALAYAYNKGVTIVAASGNGGMGGPAEYPAAYDAYVIAVGATRYDETRAPYSTTGSYVDIAAPGGDTSVNQNNDGYADGVLQQTFESSRRVCNFGYYFFQGTSMATPHVSGVAALLIANGNAITPDEVREALQSTAEDKGTSGWDPEYGWGIVDACAAVSYTSGCTSNEECGFCEKCVANTCVYQSDLEDLKSECQLGACASDFCNGAGACDYKPSTIECRAAAGVCDMAEYCTGGSADCPADAKSTAECRAAAGDCDIPEFCDGVNNDCPSDDEVQPSTYECRAAADVCDIAEYCTGGSADCPADAFKPDNTICDDFCTTGVCSGGMCSGTPITCNDGNVCTDDTCNPLTGCVYTPNTASCDDSNACTDSDVCSGGICSGSLKTCDDSNVCTDDNCDPLTGGCINTEITQCIGGDGCCPAGCDYTTDLDCPSEPSCGDGYCAGANLGENCISCQDDCACIGKKCKNGCCGDGDCTGVENAGTCPVDCA